MKKKNHQILLSALFLLPCLGKLQAQYAAIDAIKLKPLYNASQQKFRSDPQSLVLLGTVLKDYSRPAWRTQNGIAVTAVLDEFENNPFLTGLLPGLTSSTEMAKNNAPGIAFAGADLQSVIIDGIARFIVDRMKQELQAVFFQKFYEKISSAEYRDCQLLFPATYRQLLSIGKEIYRYETYLQSLRNAFGNDMLAIIPNLDNLIRNGRFAVFFEQHRELRAMALTALFLGKQISEGKSPGQVFEAYDPYEADEATGSPATDAEKARTGMIAFLQQVSLSLKSNTADQYWINASQLAQLNDPVCLRIYLGLLYERIKLIDCGHSLSFGTIMTAAAGQGARLADYFRGILNSVAFCQERFRELQRPAKKTVSDYLAYFSAVTHFWESISTNEPFSAALPVSMQSHMQQVWELYGKTTAGIDNILTAYQALQEKKYGMLLSSIRSLYSLRYDPALMQADREQRRSLDRTMDFLFEYGTLMAEVAESSDSKQVYAAINRAAMPVGGSRVKREQFFNISLAAYGGLFIGKEWIENVSDHSIANSYGLTAPIGIALSWGKIRFCKDRRTEGNKSFSLFISMIDVGAVVSFRFRNDTLNEIPKVGFRDIIAPGLHVIWGLGKTPLSLSAGWQTGTNLRSVKAGYNEYNNSQSARFSLGLLVDIPIWNLYSRKTK
ncbi:hypothetical protein [Sediminibacterium soli]|uniref:hypothetical protein n=1 Tax=Sediminibacterium soli TaxID=2698829 RepID=UPI001379E905|nr:hypothetical protein [Sediminibacterium soli]NCI46096.1 hypothetical protein [Sediminibacterium soli]